MGQRFLQRGEYSDSTATTFRQCGRQDRNWCPYRGAHAEEGFPRFIPEEDRGRHVVRIYSHRGEQMISGPTGMDKDEVGVQILVGEPVEDVEQVGIPGKGVEIHDENNAGVRAPGRHPD